MIPTTHVLPWVLKSRLSKLKKHSELVSQYYNFVEPARFVGSERMESPESRSVRNDINRVCDDVQEIIGVSGIPTSVSPLKVGHLKLTGVSVDVITNMFILSQYDIEYDTVNDVIQRSIGVYERAWPRSFLNLVNPFNYVWLLVYCLSSVLTGVLDTLGIPGSRVTGSWLFRFVRSLLTLAGNVVVVASLLKMLNLYDPLLCFIRRE